MSQPARINTSAVPEWFQTQAAWKAVQPFPGSRPSIGAPLCSDAMEGGQHTSDVRLLSAHTGEGGGTEAVGQRGMQWRRERPVQEQSCRREDKEMSCGLMRQGGLHI